MFYLDYVTDRGACRIEFASSFDALDYVESVVQLGYRIIEQAVLNDSGDVVRPERTIVDNGYADALEEWNRVMTKALTESTDDDETDEDETDEDVIPELSKDERDLMSIFFGIKKLDRNLKISIEFKPSHDDEPVVNDQSDQDSAQNEGPVVLTDAVKNEILDQFRDATGFVANRGMLTRVFSQLADDDETDEEIDELETDNDADELETDNETDNHELVRLKKLLDISLDLLSQELGEWVFVDELYIPESLNLVHDAYKTVSEAIEILSKMTVSQNDSGEIPF